MIPIYFGLFKKSSFTFTKRRSGFTLIELIVVIVILGILAAIAMPKFINMRKNARIAMLQGMDGAIKDTIELSRAAFQISTTVNRTAFYPQMILSINGETDMAVRVWNGSAKSPTTHPDGSLIKHTTPGTPGADQNGLPAVLRNCTILETGAKTSNGSIIYDCGTWRYVVHDYTFGAPFVTDPSALQKYSVILFFSEAIDLRKANFSGTQFPPSGAPQCYVTHIAPNSSGWVPLDERDFTPIIMSADC